MALAAVLGIAITARLGVWQLDRAAQKLELQSRIADRGLMSPLSADALAGNAAQVDGQLYRRVILHGRWLAEHTVFLDNRQMGGRPGFFVVTPLQPAVGDAVLVQRGWVPRNFEQRDALPAVATATGVVTLLGRVAPPPSKLFELGGADTGRIRQNLDLTSFAREIGVALRPLSVQQLDSAPSDSVLSASAGSASSPSVALAPGGEGLQREWPAPAVDVGKHHGYAFQWFALCALVTGLYVWFQIIQPRRRQRPHDLA